MENDNISVKKFFDYLDSIINNNKLSHAYLIELTDYDKDFNYIIDFTKMIFSSRSYEEVKNSQDNIFKQIDSFDYPDLRIIEPDGAFIKKQQLKDLQDDYQNKSLLNNKRVYIIKNSEKMNAASANTILKFLEEPEENIVAILLTDNRYHVLETILSRCQILTLKKDEYLDILDEDIELLKILLNPNDYFLSYRSVMNSIFIDKEQTKNKLLGVEKLLLHSLHIKYLEKKETNREFQDLIKDCDDEYILMCLVVLEENIPDLSFNINYKIWLDSLFSKLVIGG